MCLPSSSFRALRMFNKTIHSVDIMRYNMMGTILVTKIPSNPSLTEKSPGIFIGAGALHAISDKQVWKEQ